MDQIIWVVVVALLGVAIWWFKFRKRPPKSQ
jgi:hypothetical protein